MDLNTLLTQYRSRILELAKECKIKEVFVFGSVARGEAREDSDVDLLISLDKGASLLDVGRFKWKAEEILHRKVDIAFENKLHASISDQIMKEAQAL